MRSNKVINSFNCEFYLANNKKPIKTEVCSFSDWEIKQFGSLYGETLLLSLDQHYHLYKNKTNTIIHNTYVGQPVGNFNVLDFKKKAPLVSGSIGEALSILGLAACCQIPMYRIPFHRFHSSSKCPDYRIQVVAELFKTLWNLSDQDINTFPSDIPMEVKSHLNTDSKFPIGALEQVISYWKGCMNHYPQGVGYAIICRVNFKSNMIRYFLFIPKAGVNRSSLIKARKKTHYFKPERYFRV